MMTRCTRLAAMLMVTCSVAQAQYKYGLTPLNYQAYANTVASDPKKELVDLADFIPNVVLDIRYATTNNFTGERIYELPMAYARRPVAEGLRKAQREFNALGLGLKIFDAYRPYGATVKFYEVYRDTTYVASPYRGSRHNRGCAVDVTLIDLRSGEELRMPTAYDSFNRNAWPSTPIKDDEARKNRELLIKVMQKYGFRVNSSEWWHFDFIGYRKYEILDIDFEELRKPEK